MKRKTRICIAVTLLAAFVLWTAAVCSVDVAPIGPQGSRVGFAKLNGFVHNLTGVHMKLYVLTDWLGLVPVAIGFGFAILGLVQWIKRGHIGRVDRSILALGVFYVAVMGVYLLFEQVVINRRPVLIEGFLETSYPSSTTMLTLCVMPTAAMQLRKRSPVITCGIWLFTAFMVIGRLLSGVHWVTDIIGGALVSGGLVMLYGAVASKNETDL